MKTIKFLSMAALALVGAIMTSCSNDDNIIDEQQSGNKSNVVTMTTTISFEGGSQTRAVTSTGVKTFAVGEQLALVYKNTSGTTVKAVSTALTAGDITDAGKSATFTFELEYPDKTQDVTYIYPAAMANDDGTVNYGALSTQDGTLSTLSSSLDLATKTAAWNGISLPGGTLANQLAILALTLKEDLYSSEITSTITGLTLSDGSNSYAVSRSTGAGPIYVVIRPTDAASITVTATDGTNIYTKSLTGKTYAASNGYPLSWRMTNMKYVPLTLEATQDGGYISISSPRSGMQYRLNGGSKTPVTTDPIPVNKGDKVAFYGNDTKISTYGDYDPRTNISCSVEAKVYGNIMSLVDEKGFATATTLIDGDMAFASLFMNNTGLTDASGLLLPATPVSGCYQEMFRGCTSLITAPALPATTLAQSCYVYMFSGCTSLITVPALPATTMIFGCYANMFSGCTSLTTAPVLPAKTMAQYCYQSMFLNCTGLTTAPVLPATTLVNYCYDRMFSGCTNLSSVTCMATNISASNSTNNWLNGVNASGTFTTPSTTEWSEGSNGIPSGWTRVDQ